MAIRCLCQGGSRCSCILENLLFLTYEDVQSCAGTRHSSFRYSDIKINEKVLEQWCILIVLWRSSYPVSAEFWRLSVLAASRTKCDATCTMQELWICFCCSMWTLDTSFFMIQVGALPLSRLKWYEKKRKSISPWCTSISSFNMFQSTTAQLAQLNLPSMPWPS